MNHIDLTDYFVALYGDTTGRLHIAVGDGPHWRNDKYRHDTWTQSHFAYPGEADLAVREMLRAATTADAYCCVSLMHADKRAQGAAVARMNIHADLDNGRYDESKVTAVGGWAVASGTTGNAHVHVSLTESVPPKLHRALCRALSGYLGAVDPKITDNDLLRPPGTYNHKLSALGAGDPTPVEFLIRPNGRVEPATLCRLLGVDLDQPTSSSDTTDAKDTTKVDLDRHPSVKAALAVVSSPPDRSTDTMRVVAACYDAGLTLPQTRWVVNTRADLAERIGDRNDDDVQTCWRKIDDEARAQVQDDLDSDPVPLTNRVPIPPFPVDALPKTIADMVAAVAEHTQTDPAMAATSAISTLAACVGGRVEIEVRHGWTEPLCLHTASVSAPGERKSAVQAAMVKPVYAAERKLVDKVTPDHRDAVTRRDVALKSAERLRNAAAKTDDPDEQGRLTNAAVFAMAEADGIHVPAIPRLVCDDITPEALGSLLAEQDGKAALISAEAGVFDIIGGRYSGNIANLDIWLKGHSGDPVRVDRKNRPPEYIAKPALTLGLMVQPSVIDAIAGHREFRGRGLLARFLFAYPTSKVGRRRVETAPVPEAVETEYGAAVEALAYTLGVRHGEPAVLKLTDTAHTAMVRIGEAVEPALGDDGDLAALKDWGSKYVGAAARIAGILHMAERGVSDGLAEPVSADTVHAAWQIAEYYRACAIRAFSDMGADQATADAQYLLERITRAHDGELSERDIFNAASRSRFKSMADIRPGIGLLVDHGWLIPLDAAKPTGGRPASQRYKIHPHAAKHAEHAKGAQQ